MTIKISLNNADRSFILSYIEDGTVGAEIGVWRGEFSAAILKTKQIKKLHLIDAWICYNSPGGVLKETDTAEGAEEARYQEVLSRFSENIKKKQVIIHKAFSKDAASDIKNNSLDWIYIDAGHSYEDVSEDLNNYYSKMKSGSFIMGDDYNPNAWIGVVNAVDEFRNREDIETISLEHCQFVLRKK